MGRHAGRDSFDFERRGVRVSRVAVGERGGNARPTKIGFLVIVERREAAESVRVAGRDLEIVARLNRQSAVFARRADHREHRVVERVTR